MIPDKDLIVETKKLDSQVVLIIKNNTSDTIDVTCDNQKIESLFPQENSVMIWDNEQFDDAYCDQLSYIIHNQYTVYTNYQENTYVDISNQNVTVSLNQIDECFGEVIVFFYENDELVDVCKKSVDLENKDMKFESHHVFDQAKVTYRLYK